ncbi:MAG: membrane dipeptidase [Nitrospirae bacterium]|nr:membrane dipeptidase [Nitrospirota bacterium]
MVETPEDPKGAASRLGISLEAIDLIHSSDVIDLHVDSFIWSRVFGYDISKRHGRGILGGRYYSQVDLPRLTDAGVSGAIWSITTNPFRRGSQRSRIFGRNLARMKGILASHPDQVRFVRTAGEYREARRSGCHAAFLGVQGGNALDVGNTLDGPTPHEILKVTLVHLVDSSLGGTSSPLGNRKRAGLTPAGREFVKRLDSLRIFVDLAHIHRTGFFDAVQTHDRSLPLMVSHTGTTGVLPHWRNIDDEQIRAVAETGGVIGVMYKTAFLGAPPRAVRSGHVVDHLQHLIDAGGEDTAALGSDWDGFIETPRDMPTCEEWPRLVQAMLDRGWKEERVRKILGGNVLRAIGSLRG